MREIFDPATVKLVNQYFLNQGRVIPIFHRKQCLFIMREAMRQCPDLTGMQPGEVQERLTQLGLMANEHASATALSSWR
jgi:hypothetical protein